MNMQQPVPAAMKRAVDPQAEISARLERLPITREVYLPILKELEEHGIVFHEKQVLYMGYNPQNVAR